MYVDVSDPLAVKPVVFDEYERLVVVRHNNGREFLQKFQNHWAIGQVPTRDFSNHQRVHGHGIAREQFGEPILAPAQVVDPD
jgi:hypothetical protein